MAEQQLKKIQSGGGPHFACRAGRWGGLTLCAVLAVALLMQTAALLLGAVALCVLCLAVAALLVPRQDVRRVCALARRALCSGKALLEMLDKLLPQEGAAHQNNTNIKK